jgi:putative ABC transport system permease protein
VDLALGKADAVIQAEGLPFDQKYLSNLQPLAESVRAYPIIRGYGEETSSNELIEIIGTDLQKANGIRNFTLKTKRKGLTGLLPLLLDPKGIILPEEFIPGAEFQPGDTIRLVVNGRERQLNVNGILETKATSKALTQNYAVMHLLAAQNTFGKIGKLDRIDLEFLNDEKFEVMKQKISEVLPGFLRVDRPEYRNRQVEKMLRAFQYNLTALSFVALLVGLYLIYNMVSLSVVRRRTEIGTLRAMGASPGLIASIFLLEAGVIGTLGSALGIGLGYYMAQFSLEAVALTVNNLYASTQVTTIDFRWDQMGFYFLFGVGLSFISAVIPAWDAATTSPTQVMRRGSYDLKIFRGNRKLTLAGWVMCLLAGLCSLLPSIGQFPYFGFLSVFFIVMGISFLAPSGLLVLRDLAHGLCRRLFGGEGLLASMNLSQNVGRNSIAVSSLAIAFMMVISMSIMVHSFRQTVEVWINQTLQADLFVRVAGGKTIDYEYTLPLEKVAALRKFDGVKAVDMLRALPISYDNAPAILASGDFNTLSRYGNLVIKRGPPTSELAGLLAGHNRAIVSESFSLKHQVTTGDHLTLNTPAGKVEMEIAAVYYDYSQERGLIILDRGTYLKYYNDPNVNSFVVYLKKAEDLPLVRREIIRTIGSTDRIIVRSNQELKKEVLRIFDNTFAITYSLEIIGIGVAVLGLFNTLISLIIERRREIGILRFIGAFKEQVKKMILIEAGLLGVIGSAYGLVAGIVVSYILIFVINKQSFGWTILVHFPYGFIFAAVILFWAIACSAGLYPARLATRLNPKESVRSE